MLSQTNGAKRPATGAPPKKDAGEPAAGARPANPPLRMFRPDSPYVALGLAVNHLMTKPAFANLKFGDWARILVGQINRKHYSFVLDERNQVQGFVGWALTTQEHAEAWVENRGGLSFEDSQAGNCIIFNAWSATSLKVNRIILREARKIIAGKDMVYFKRFYKDGRTKPMRLTVNEFVERHIARADTGG